MLTCAQPNTVGGPPAAPVAPTPAPAVLALDPAAARTAETAGLGFAHLYALCRLPSPASQRRLARLAVDHAWSVRALERAVARERAGPRAHRPKWSGAHPDALALAETLEDAISRATGVPVAVRVLRGHRFEFRYLADTPAQARSVAERLGATPTPAASC